MSSELGLVMIEQLCRTCCSSLTDTSRASFNIFASDKICQQIKVFLSIEVDEGDGLPKSICGQCRRSLESFILFRKISIKNDVMLRELKTKIEEKNGQLQTSNFEVAGLNAVKSLKPNLISQNLTPYPTPTESLIGEDICVEPEAEDASCENELEGLQDDEDLPETERQDEKDDKKSICFEEKKNQLMNSKLFQQMPVLISKIKFHQCDFCNKMFQSKEKLQGHILGHISKQTYQCERCEKYLSSKACLKYHEKRHTGSWSRVCKFCNKGFVEKTSFSYHIRSQHTKEKPFKCDKCSKAFFKNQDLKIHLQRIHSEQPENLVKVCPTCNKVVRDKEALRLHAKTHIPVEQRRKYQCKECTSSFTCSSALKKHNLIHTGEMPFECNICGHKIRTKKGYELHVINHSGIKSFMCEVCGKSFALENTLKIHMRTHTGEKPYLCNLCGKRFAQSSSYKNHLRSCGRKKV